MSDTEATRGINAVCGLARNHRATILELQTEIAALRARVAELEPILQHVQGSLVDAGLPSGPADVSASVERLCAEVDAEKARYQAMVERVIAASGVEVPVNGLTAVEAVEHLRAQVKAHERAYQEGHPDPCTLGPLCPYCEIAALRARCERLKTAVARMHRHSYESRWHSRYQGSMRALSAIMAEHTALRAKLEAAESHRDGLYRVMRALAEDDRPRLATVDERIQANVDAVVVKRIELETKVNRLERVVLPAREVREALAALMRAVCDQSGNRNANIITQWEAEMGVLGIEPGFGKRIDEALAALDAKPAARLAEIEQAQWDRVHWGGEEP